MCVANMLAGPLISVSTEIARRVRPGGLILLTGFRRESLPSVSAAFAPYFDVETSDNGSTSSPMLCVAMEREGWLAVEARRNANIVQSNTLSDAAVD